MPRHRDRARPARRAGLGVLVLAVVLGIALPLTAFRSSPEVNLRAASGGVGRTTPGSTPAIPTKPPVQTVLVTVPDVVGQNKAQAMQTLIQVGLRIGLVGQIDPGVPVGVVLSQSPAPGSSIPRGGQVTVTVSAEGAPLDGVDWAAVSYPVNCGGTPSGTVAGYPEPVQGRQVAVVYVQCPHGAGSPPSAVLVYDYAASTTSPHLLQTLLSYQDDWSPAPNGLAATGAELSIHVYGYTGSAPRCCPNVSTTLYWSWSGASYTEASSEPTHDTLPH